jgi:hypothetical protein
VSIRGRAIEKSHDSQRRTNDGRHGAGTQPKQTEPEEKEIMKTRLSVLLVVLSCLALGTGAALAEFPEGVPDTVQVDIGGTYSNLDTNFGVSSSNAGVGAIVTLEDVMNLASEQSTWRINGNWRFTKRQHIDFGYVEYKRSGSRVNNQTFTWGDYTFNAGNKFDGSFDESYTYVAYRYDFLQDPHVRISGSAGVSYIDLKTSLKGSGSIETPDGTQEGIYETKGSIGLPVPLIGLQLNWALGAKWEIELYDRFLFINMPDISGGVNESAVRAKWHFTRHVGAAIGMDRDEVILKRYKNGDKTYKGGISAQGWSAYLTLAF